MPTRCPQKIISLTLLILSLTACAQLEPRVSTDPVSESQPLIPPQWRERLPIGSSALGNQLLELIDSPPLEDLVLQTLTHNQDLRQTALRLKEQRLLARQTDAGLKPELNFNLNSERSKDTSFASNYRLSLDMSWEIDVWGRLADQYDASLAEIDAASFDYQAAADSLAARTIQLWLDILMRDQMIRAEQHWILSLSNTEAVIADSYRNGLRGSNALADLETARANTALIRASLTTRRQQQREAMRQLAALQGKTAPLALQLPSEIPRISNPPVVLPATLIGHRPDLQAALSRLTAADLRAIVSRKQLLPSFNLSASLNQSRPRLEDLLSGSTAWSLLGQLTAPLFNGGRLRTDVELAELATERHLLSYQQLLLNALNEVENALGQEASLAEQQRLLESALEHSDASLQHYRARYREGLNDILDLLNAQQSAFSNRIQLLQTQQARLNNRIRLALALGMGV